MMESKYMRPTDYYTCCEEHQTILRQVKRPMIKGDRIKHVPCPGMVGDQRCMYRPRKAAYDASGGIVSWEVLQLDKLEAF